MDFDYIKRRLSMSANTETGIKTEIEKEIKRLMPIVEARLKNERLIHSLGVMKSAEALAKRYGADPDKALIAGLLHDITKEYSCEQHMELIKKYDVPIDEGEKNTLTLLHAITSAAFARFEAGITDDEILNAIRYHTTGRTDMTILERIIYVADFIEPNRKYADVEYFRTIAFEDLDKTLYLGIKWCMEDLLRKDAYLHVNTLNGYNYFIKN
jgi:predicted HD superfamily hydrolase involved in NAD metabolism